MLDCAGWKGGSHRIRPDGGSQDDSAKPEGAEVGPRVAMAAALPPTRYIPARDLQVEASHRVTRERGEVQPHFSIVAHARGVGHEPEIAGGNAVAQGRAITPRTKHTE